jgi:Na+:H+ antiporter, NhaA family
LLPTQGVILKLSHHSNKDLHYSILKNLSTQIPENSVVSPYMPFQKPLDLFKEFFQSEIAGGMLLIFCTILSISLANTSFGESYIHLIHTHLDLSFWNIRLDHSLEQWVNDGLMAVFFLLVGLEIERELYKGELSSFKNALLPILAAIGGMTVPALIHFLFNAGTPYQQGFGIPMATDIAFALGILSLAGSRIPVSLKIFLTALAIIDDLGAITVIAVFYTKSFSWIYLAIALAIFGLLFMLGKRKYNALPVYIIGGIIMWYCMMQSGIHATIAGVLLAFAIPFHREDAKNISYALQHALHKPAAYFILPVFALVNTAIVLPQTISSDLLNSNATGIITGLFFGKLIGILGFSYLAIKLGWSALPQQVSWRLMTGAALLGGIGFTMSLFIANLAFQDAQVITESKLSILVSSLLSAIIGLTVLVTGSSREKSTIPGR